MFALTRVNAKVTDDLNFKLFYRVFESESCACALIPVTAVRQTLFCRRHAATRISDRGLNLAIVIGSTSAIGRHSFNKLRISSNIPFVLRRVLVLSPLKRLRDKTIGPLRV